MFISKNTFPENYYSKLKWCKYENNYFISSTLLKKLITHHLQHYCFIQFNISTLTLKTSKLFDKKLKVCFQLIFISINPLFKFTDKFNLIKMTDNIKSNN